MELVEHKVGGDYETRRVLFQKLGEIRIRNPFVERLHLRG